jgi:hypothetical protein
LPYYAKHNSRLTKSNRGALIFLALMFSKNRHIIYYSSRKVLEVLIHLTTICSTRTLNAKFTNPAGYSCFSTASSHQITGQVYEIVSRTNILSLRVKTLSSDILFTGIQVIIFGQIMKFTRIISFPD